MTTTRRIGRTKEMKVKRILEKAGYDVQLAPMPTRWSKQNDMWGLWDAIAINRNEIRFIQVKSQMIYGEQLEPYEQWACPSNCSKEIWVMRKFARQPIIKIIKGQK